MNGAPKRLWFAPDEGPLDALGWAGVASGKDRLFFEDDNAHHPDDDGVEYIRADIAIAEIERLTAERDALADWAGRLAECLGAQVAQHGSRNAARLLRDYRDVRAALAKLEGREE